MQMLETEKDKLVFRILNATESEQSRREIELCRGNLQSWALDNTSATLWPWFQADKLTNSVKK